MGVHALSPEQLLAAQSFLLETGLHQPVVAAITWSKFKPLYEASRARMLLAELADVQDRQLTVGELSTAGQATNNLAQELDALAPNQRVGWMTRMLQQAAARCMGMSHPEQIEPEQSLLAFGLDSLMAVELRNWIIQTFALTVPLTDFLEGGTVSSVAKTLVEQMFTDASGVQLQRHSDAAEGPIDLDESHRSAPTANSDASRIDNFQRIWSEGEL